MKLKKVVQLALATTTLLFSSVAYASEPTVEETEDIFTEGKLNLELVKEKALEENGALVMVEHQYELQQAKRSNTYSDLADIDDSIDELSRQRPRPSYIPNNCGPDGQQPCPPTPQQQLDQALSNMQRGQIESQIEQMQNQEEQLELMIEQLNEQTKQAKLDIEETKIAIQYGVTAQYVQLLLLTEQLAKLESSLKNAEELVQKQELFHRYGMVSFDEVEEAEKQWEDLQFNYDQTEENYYNQLKKLCTDIGIQYNHKYELEPVPLKEEEIKLLVKPENEELAELIAGSYQLQKAQSQLKIAEETKDSQEDEDDPNKELELNVTMAEQQINNLKSDLEVNVTSAYQQLHTSYKDYQNAIRTTSEELKSFESIKKQFEVGLISQFDFKQTEKSIDQLQTNLNVSKFNYYLALEKINYIEKGYFVN